MVDKEIKEQIIRDYIDNWLSLSEISKKYGIKSKSYISQYILGDKVRSSSEAIKLAHKKHPNKFKLSEETKDKIRKAHLRWMKEHPEQTAWRLKNMSYPEKCFQKILEDNGLDKKYLIYREYSVFPYFIDFAFINEKLAVEIDGSQHLEEDRKKKDEEKDKLLLSKGWKVLRITATEVTHDGTKALKGVLDMLEEPTMQYEVVGILKAPKTHQKVERGEDGLSDKERNKAFNQRKVKNRPSKEELWEIVKTKTFAEIGREYNVNGNTIKKWCVDYNLPFRKKDIDDIIGKKRFNHKHKATCKLCGKEFNALTIKNVFCSRKCSDEYKQKYGNKEFYADSKIGYNYIYKINEDGSFTNKRVGKDEIEMYVVQGWIRGRKL
jgi:very-short-patch-repair endonuclease